jgi:hypothetical protein
MRVRLVFRNEFLLLRSIWSGLALFKGRYAHFLLHFELLVAWNDHDRGRGFYFHFFPLNRIFQLLVLRTQPLLWCILVKPSVKILLIFLFCAAALHNQKIAQTFEDDIETHIVLKLRENEEKFLP